MNTNYMNKKFSLSLSMRMLPKTKKLRFTSDDFFAQCFPLVAFFFADVSVPGPSQKTVKRRRRKRKRKMTVGTI